MEDPIAAELGLSPRKIIRDPFGEKEGDKKEGGRGRLKDRSEVQALTGGNKAEGLDTHATYENNGGVRENNTTLIQPVEV